MHKKQKCHFEFSWSWDGKSYKIQSETTRKFIYPNQYESVSRHSMKKFHEDPKSKDLKIKDNRRKKLVRFVFYEFWKKKKTPNFSTKVL